MPENLETIQLKEKSNFLLHDKTYPARRAGTQSLLYLFWRPIPLRKPEGLTQD